MYQWFTRLVKITSTKNIKSVFQSTYFQFYYIYSELFGRFSSHNSFSFLVFLNIFIIYYILPQDRIKLRVRNRFKRLILSIGIDFELEK